MELIIDKVIKGGLGLARTAEGQVVMVGRVLPGEQVRVAINRRHRGYLEAELLEVLQPSPHRIASRCPVYAFCGGCDLQHADYAEQLTIKQAILAETLGRAGLWQDQAPTGPMVAPLPSPDQFGYRQRVRLQVVDGQLGFFGRRSHGLVAVQHCPLAAPPLNTVLGTLAEHPASTALLAEALELELLLDVDQGRVVAVVHGKAGVRRLARQAAVSLCQGIPLLAVVCFARQGKHGLACVGDIEGEWLDTPWLSSTLPAELCGTSLSLGHTAGSFCQVNTGQNANCIRQLLDWIKGDQPSQAIDLFCGMGNFSLPLAAAGWQVSGMDTQHSSIESAKRNAQANGLAERCHFEAASAWQAAERLVAAGKRFELLLLDPPRAGCAELIPLLPKLAKHRIVMISCDPATLARDLTGLIGQGFRMAEVRLVDMFPQTAHIETMINLVVREDVS